MTRNRARGRADRRRGLDEQLVALARVQRADGRDQQRLGREAELAPNGLPVVGLGLRPEGIHIQADEVEVDQRLLGRADPLQVAADLGRDDQDLLGAERQEPVAQPGGDRQLARRVLQAHGRADQAHAVQAGGAAHAQGQVDGHRRGGRERVHQVDAVLDDQAPDLARGLGHADGRGDLERRGDVRAAGALELVDQLAAGRDHPHCVAATVELAGQADHDAFQPAHTHGLRGEQNPHRPRRL
jgi:hypothetical protein